MYDSPIHVSGIFLLLEVAFSMGKLNRDVKFEGKIESVYLGAAVDGISEMVVSGKRVMIDFGGVPVEGYPPILKGKIIGIDLNKSEEYVGKTVEVFCQKSKEGYTLEGNEKYYVKLKKGES